jgi:hypothetical protein
MNASRSEVGAINVLLIPLILLSLLFIGVGAFGYWAYTSRQDYKNNTDKKVAAAVQTNTIAVKAEDAKKFAEAAKQPLKDFNGPEAYGSVHISYPKTWSGYVVTANTGTPLDGYFHADVVPGVVNSANTFGLRVQVLPQQYSAVVKQLNGPLQQKKITVTPYALPKVPDEIGVRVEGQIAQNKQGSMVILPMRDKTLKLWTEIAEYKADFDNNILPNVTFSP